MKYIWIEEERERGFAEFRRKFFWRGGRATLRITADYRYAAYIGGRLVSNAQYADLPERKSVNETDVTPFLKKGENVLYIVAAHAGEDFAVSRTMVAAVGFEILENGEVIAASDENAEGRVAANYEIGDKITSQIGYGWRYDFTAAGGPWRPGRKVETGFSEVKRPVKAPTISSPLPCEVVAQGIFRYRGGKTAAERLQNAWMSTLRFSEMTGKERLTAAASGEPLRFSAAGGDGADGIFFIVDLKRETCGHLTFCVVADKPCKAAVGWGEHLADLRVRTEREGRNFACELALKAGENALDEYLYRIGCRYLCMYIESESAELVRLSVRETLYPFRLPEKHFGDRLLDKIYETGRRTLMLCAHDHYEDCPWREQALYGMDSRNQMLFGYGAFGEYELPRASLRLFADSLEEDGLIPLCAPARGRITIPSFSVYWLLAVCENAEADFDGEFVREMLPKAEKMLEIFRARSSGRGVSLFREPRYWNFHEWCEGLDGGNFNRTEDIPEEKDGILTALVRLASAKLSALERRLGRAEKAEDLRAFSESLRDGLEYFYDPDAGLYASYADEGGNRRGYHAYMQAAALSAADNMPEARKKSLCAALKAPEGKMTKMTLAALPMLYDAVMATDGDIGWCVENICSVFGKMLFSGATSYWETENGEADFNDAGSLCHGWSAVGCYVFDKYLGGGK